MSDAKSLIEQIAAGEHDQVSQHPEGYEVCLRFPFKAGSETVDRLVVKRPRLKHFRQAESASSGGQLAHSIALAALLTGRSPKDLDEVTVSDWQIIEASVLAFSVPDPRTGE